MNFIVSCEVYPFSVMVSFDENNKEVSHRLKKLGISQEEIKMVMMNSTTHGKYMMFSNQASIIRLPVIPKDPYWIATLSHEVLHCVIEVFRRVGLPLSSKSEEAYTYLYGYLIQKILEKIQ